MHMGPVLGCATCLVAQGLHTEEGPIVALLKFILFEQVALHFHFALGPIKDVAHPDETFPSPNAVRATLGILKSLLRGGHVCVGGTMPSHL